MARKWLDKPRKTWQPLQDESASVILDTHASGEYVAMQVNVFEEVEKERAAVWSTKTRNIVWHPDKANAICWVPQGDKILVLVEFFQPDPKSRGIITTPLQSEVRHFFEQRSWPEARLISRCPIKPATGWLVDVVATPSGQLACCVWCDQGEAGLELISLADGKPYQMERRGYFGPSNLIQGPAFSSDSRFLALTYGKSCWWSKDPEVPSRGGDLPVGWVIVGDLENGEYRKIKVKASVPRGWLPKDPEDDVHNELLSCPEFIDQDRFKVVLPNGQEYLFSASAAKQV